MVMRREMRSEREMLATWKIPVAISLCRIESNKKKGIAEKRLCLNLEAYEKKVIWRKRTFYIYFYLHIYIYILDAGDSDIGFCLSFVHVRISLLCEKLYWKGK